MMIRDRGLRKTDTFPIKVSDLDNLLDRIAALEAENEKLRNPWTYITPGDPATLPPRFTAAFLSVRIGNVDCVIAGYYDDKSGRLVNAETFHTIQGIVYAYLLPDGLNPAPYPGE